ncbi:uncharacterized protein PHLOEM PROTEIN 2-LIKE A7-like [Eutrema salsugineum]|uniref:uncharacterized protein PHLOEM PROTEIN 2-LIKE A7-like n=1 Tax=Eutrema salsugineum TaxID=72664 RepID=UPI000CED0231|nr:uncharacterized protein PHLOEM PROTEIN 2-LIKE A7-like [Eutrema salsugineum]
MGDLVPATEKSKEGGSSSSIQCLMLTTTNYTVWAMRMRVCLKNRLSSRSVNLIQQRKFGTVKTRYVGAERVREARLQTLMTDFDRMKMKESEKIDDFSGKLSEISSKSAALGVSIEDSKLVKKFLKSLPRKYIHIVASLEQVLDLNTITFEEIIGRLKAYEDRISEDSEEQKDTNKLMYANTEDQTGNQTAITTTTGEEEVTEVEEAEEAQESNNSETQSANELLMHEVIYLNERNCTPSEYETNSGDEDLWYLDNGASNHMTGDRRYFSDIDETITGKVRFGDDSRIDIKGKGSISFTDMNGEPRMMTDVYFIPDLKSNIISLGQAT